MPRGPLLASAAFGLLALAAPRAFADATTEAQLRAALQSSTAQIAQLEDQVADLQAAQAPDVATIEALRAQLQALQASKASAAATPAESTAAAGNTAALAALRRQLSASRAAIGRLQSQYATASGDAGSAAARNDSLQTQLAARNDSLRGCSAENARLYALGNQILDAYSHKDDLLAGFTDHEPFTRLKRVQLQNIVQDDQDQLDDNRIP